MSERAPTFARRLQTLREAAGLSQYALAKRSGLSKQALSRLELGDREPSWTTVQSLAAALSVSCEAFVDPAIAARIPVAETAPAPGRPRKATALDKTRPPAKRRGRHPKL
jgi:transcriptional regulator with XRE-family HTH domain